MMEPLDHGRDGYCRYGGMWRRAMLLGAAAVALCVAGCPKGRAPGGKGKADRNAPTAAIVVLFDISGSTSSRQIRERYMKDFQKILDSIKGGEVVMGDVITDNTLATASFPIDSTFPVYNPFLVNKNKHDIAMESGLESARKAAEKVVLEGESAPKSDLMNAFQLADKVFNGKKCGGAGNKVLIVFSDMVEQSDRYNFDGENLTQNRTVEILEKERQGGRLPDLQGVEAWVAGATAARTGGLTSDKIFEIQNFWLSYFKACGADLTKERYATTLINFALPDKGK